MTRRTLAGAGATLALVLVLWAAGPEPSTDPAYGQTLSSNSTFECGYEDVLAFELKDPAYDLQAGYTICLHIDQVKDAPTPD